MNLKTCALIVALTAAAAGTASAEDLGTAYARQEVERSSQWAAYRFDDHEKVLGALVDRVFMSGRRSPDGGAYELDRGVGPTGPVKAGEPTGFQSATVLGEAGPSGRFRPRTLLVDYDLTERLAGGGLRHRRWEAVVDLDSGEARVRFAGDIVRPDGTSAPDLEGDPRDGKGWAKALSELSAAWGIRES